MGERFVGDKPEHKFGATGHQDSSSKLNMFQKALRGAKSAAMSAALLATPLAPINAIAAIPNTTTNSVTSTPTLTGTDSAAARVNTEERDWPSLQEVKTQNWAGYVAFSNTRVPSPDVTSITGTWRVPLLWNQCGWIDTDHPPKWSFGFSSQYVGIGGHFSGDHSLIQIGTIANYYFGKNADILFYETETESGNEVVYKPVVVRNFEVEPGDVIRAKIDLIDDKTNLWHLTVENLTRHEHFSVKLRYKSSRLSAEWIEERSVGEMFGLMLFGPLPGFSEVHFMDINREDSNYATIGGVEGGIADFRHQKSSIWEYEDNNLHNKPHESAGTSRLDHNGRGFSVYKLDCTDDN